MSAPRPTRLAIKLAATVGFLILYIPLAVVVGDSFWDIEQGWTLKWFRAVLSDETILSALGRSVWIASAAAAVSTVIGTLAALAIERYRFPGRKVLDWVTYVPVMVPELVLGLSLLIWFVLLRVTLGQFSIFIAHVSFSISYVVITVKARLDGFDHSLEEAARDLSASALQTFFRVTLPLIAPGVVSGALLAFTLSFDDFLITFFTAGVGADTLPLKIYSMVKFGISPEISALSTIMLGVTVVLVVAGTFAVEIRGRSRLKQNLH